MGLNEKRRMRRSEHECPRCGGEGLRVESYQPEALYQDMGGYGIIAPEIGPDGR